MKKTVIAHSACWRSTLAQAPTSGTALDKPAAGRPIDERTRVRHAAVHDLLGGGVGLLEMRATAGLGVERGQALRPRRRRAAATATALAHAELASDN